MGTEKDATKNKGEKKTPDAGEENKPAPTPTAAGGGKKEEEPIHVVLKMDLHCEGCAKKVRRSIANLEGVIKVTTDFNAKKLMVTGNVDPNWLRLTVENKTKKKVQLISPPSKTPTAADNNPQDNKPKENKPTADNNKNNDDDDDNNKNPIEAVVSTVVLKIKLHCDGCAQKVRKVIQRNIDGVHSIQTDLQKNLVTLNGTMDVKKLTSYLKEKLKRNVDILTPSSKGNGDKTAKDGVSAEKKEKGSAAGERTKNQTEQETKVEVNKMEYSNNSSLQTYYTTPMYNHTSYVSQEYSMPVYSHQPYLDNGYVAHYRGPPTPPPTLIMNDSMFSDENPNGCSVM